MSDGSGEIIVKGGSVDLQFDGTLYQRSLSDPAKHGNPNRKITSIVIVDEEGTEKFNSGESSSGLRWTVTVHTK